MAVFSGHQMFALPRSGILWIHEKYHKILFASKIGIIQSALRGRTPLTLGGSLVEGLIVGLLFWVIIWLFSGILINHQQLGFGEFLYSFVPLLLYGLLLGSIFFQRATSKS